MEIIPSNNGLKLENRIFSFTGDRWGGKTMLASIFASFDDYKKVYCNYDLKLFKPVTRFKDFDLYSKLDFDDISKKLLIFDEGGINANARNFQGKLNKLLSYFIFVSRKFNIDCLFITQDFDTFEKNIRRQTNFLFEISNNLPSHLNVEIWKMKRGEQVAFFGEYEIKALEIMQNQKITYDTRDLSGFEDKLKDFL